MQQHDYMAHILLDNINATPSFFSKKILDQPEFSSVFL